MTPTLPLPDLVIDVSCAMAEKSLVNDVTDRGAGAAVVAVVPPVVALAAVDELVATVVGDVLLLLDPPQPAAASVVSSATDAKASVLFLGKECPPGVEAGGRRPISRSRSDGKTPNVNVP